MPVHDDAIHGYILTRTYHENVTLFHLRDRNNHLRAVLYHGRIFRCQLHKPLQCIRGLALGMCLKHLADRDQRKDHGCRFKIKLMHIFHDLVHIPGKLCARHRKQRVGAVHK